ncbi:MAG: ATP-binding protein [Marvinbryantia sp.]|uniref:sensor histidine kinase n=1 Tax=Marvinbryantia sp. TaxID=2496532 RepID=UPI0025DDE136|nr:HAMP domain-containing sensor histidine kinase [uncultured Marvinbryantia sp.]
MIKKLRASLTIKIFLLVSLLLLAASGVTYAAVVWFLPAFYSNELENSIDRLSQELKKIIESFSGIEEASNAIALFQGNTQTSVAILDEDGAYVWYWVEVGTTVESGVVTEYAVSDAASYAAEDTVVEEDIVSEEAFSTDEEAAEGENGTLTGEDAAAEGDAFTGEDVAADGDGFSDGEMTATAVDGQESAAEIFPGEGMEGMAVKSYPLTVGGESYTMFVTGGKQQVDQAMEILRQIFPYILAIAVCVAVLSALAASFYLTAPVVRLSRISRKMAKLDYSERYTGKRTDEIGALGQDLNELADNLSGALTELRQANARLKSDIELEREQEKRRMAFFSAVSHELKTPITILKGHLSGMLQGVGEYRNRDYYLQRSQETAEKMEDMVQELLTVSRMETTPFTVAQTDLAEQLRLQLAELTELFETKELELVLDIPEHLYAEVNASLMEKVFRNLLTNALRYTPAGEGNQIRLQLRQQEKSIFFDIENTGAHIPEDALPHIFEAFYRVEQSRSRQMGGSGLGLYIVRMALEQHGARQIFDGHSGDVDCAGEFGAENTKDGVRFYWQLHEKHTETPARPQTAVVSFCCK